MKVKLTTILLIFAVFCASLGIGIGYGFKTVSVNRQVRQQVNRKLNKYANEKLAEQRKDLKEQADEDRSDFKSQLASKAKQLSAKDDQIKSLSKENKQLLQQASNTNDCPQQGPLLTPAQEVVYEYYRQKTDDYVMVVPVKKIGIAYHSGTKEPVVTWIKLKDPYSNHIYKIWYNSSGTATSTSMPMDCAGYYNINLDYVPDCKMKLTTHDKRLDGKHVNVLVSRPETVTRDEHIFTDGALWKLKMITLKYRP